MKVSLLTLGCKANQAESSALQSHLSKNGCRIVELSEKPDICIINTCTVTAKSDRESRQMIRKAGASAGKIIATGCYSEMNKDTVKDMIGAGLVVDNDDKLSIAKMIAPDTSGITLGFTGKSRFFLKVQDGCNFSCTYCIIPKARGRSRSMEIHELKAMVSAAADNFSEVVLTGIHLGTYGYDLNPKASVSDLLKALLETKIKRIRLSSIEINEIDDELLELLHDERICRHLHIPLQSGDDSVLKKMHRNYTVERFRKGIERISRSLPDISIGVDVIAGFPGEGAQEFENTRNLLESLPATYLHVFNYSRRPGTLASEMHGQVGFADKKERAALLNALDRTKRTEHMKTQIGKILDPLIEKKDADGSCTGITSNYLRVKTLSKEASMKTIERVRVNGIENDMLYGDIIKSLQ